MNKKYKYHFLLWLITGLSLAMCKEDENPGLTTCQMKYIDSWTVMDHFVYFENDSLVSEYTANYNLQFIPDGSGIISHPWVEPQSFDWECTGDTLVIANGMNGSLFVANGKYILANESDSTLTLEKHLLFDEFGLKIESWRTWNFTRK